VARCGFLDAVNEPARTAMVLTSPTLVFLALFGYFWPRGDNMIVTFRRGSRATGPSSTSSRSAPGVVARVSPD
jgi:hypothetical protein